MDEMRPDCFIGWMYEFERRTDISRKAYEISRSGDTEAEIELFRNNPAIPIIFVRHDGRRKVNQ